MHLSLKVVVTLFALLVLLFSDLGCGSTSTRSDQDAPKGMEAFVGGKFEASGVTNVSGTEGILFVDNARAGQVCWMRLDQKGHQVGTIETFNLGVSIEDVEGITTDGAAFYVVSSQSRPKAIANDGLVRFRFDQRSKSISSVESISGLKKFLIDNVAELRQEGDRKSKDGGLNIEGLAWDRGRNRLLLGLRSPLVDGQALLIPLKMRDSQGAFSIDNLEVENSRAIRLRLGGFGIRSIEYDSRAKVFRIISGAAENQDATDFVLWTWNGDEGRPVLQETHKFEKSLKPEGVARATVGNRDFLIVVFDAGGYTVIE
jgi:hypothetical protein